MLYAKTAMSLPKDECPIQANSILAYPFCASSPLLAPHSPNAVQRYDKATLVTN